MVLLYTGLCRGVCEWCCFTLACVVACVSGVVRKYTTRNSDLVQCGDVLCNRNEVVLCNNRNEVVLWNRNEVILCNNRNEVVLWNRNEVVLWNRLEYHRDSLFDTAPFIVCPGL